MSKHLSDYFRKIAYKKLSAVEADSSISHQHEFNGIGNLKEILGTEKMRVEVVQMYLDDDSEEPEFSKSDLTWYDARENHPTRSEYRLYYKESPVTAKFREGDLMIIAQQSSGQFLNIFARSKSTAENQLKMLFGISEATSTIETQAIVDTHDVRLDFVRNFIIEKLGLLDEKVTEADHLAEMLRLFPNGLPTTREFSKFARNVAASAKGDPDDLIMEWWNTETMLFKIYEKYQFISRASADQNDIDAFISLSLSMQNTRKSRAGSALENHIEELFAINHIAYSRTPTTENNSKPDFIFPSIESYRDLAFPEESLRMLAVKTSCKDRWRQVLPEAVRISHKHLLTLEPAISQNQTDEMKSHNLTLVLPKGIHDSYNMAQRQELLTVNQFIELVSS
jgi:hypothetical protein